MENKEIYYKALLENKGRLNEIDLGERMGFDENETRELIAQLLSEHKIEYVEHRACSYRPIRTSKGRNIGG
ncbi:hypothetical protein [Flagellimonas onchidii]|uniref:hypothetical protein n=1 Tax=Flagellimonas onchidii TaxID=2562684 RepID=UPI0010A6605C|nr:hypothetical protein [Allomuricauda onchidii]